MICRVLAMEMLQGVWKQHLRPRAVVGYGLKIFLPSPPNYVTRTPGNYLDNAYLIFLVVEGRPMTFEKFSHEI